MTQQTESLSHYGVKGMKWGVRKDRDRSTESRALRKQSAKTLNNYMWEATKNDPLYQSMTKEEYDRLSTRGKVFAEKNATLKRVSFSPNEVMSGYTYVSKLQADANFYKAAMPSVGPTIKKPGGGKKRYESDSYEIEMKTVKRLSSPSDKERVDAFIEILKEPSIKLPGKDAPVTGREYLEKTGYKFRARKKTDEEFGLEVWYDFVASQGNKDSPLNTAYFNKLAGKGYDVVPDDFDRGSVAKEPLILLNPKGSIKVSNVRKLTTDEINQAQRDLAR